MRRVALSLLAFAALSIAAPAADKPNFVWIISEDNSSHYLEHFFPGGAPTPNITAMAAHGLTYEHASPMPRSAPSRARP